MNRSILAVLPLVLLVGAIGTAHLAAAQPTGGGAAPGGAAAGSASGSASAPASVIASGSASAKPPQSALDQKVTDATAKLTQAQQALATVKKIALDVQAKKDALAKLPTGAAATADSKQLEQVLNQNLTDDWNKLVDLDPSFDVVAKDPNASIKSAQTKLDAAQKALDDANTAAETKRKTDAVPAQSLQDRLRGARQARCATAYCWGGDDGTRYSVEPMLELPLGTTYSLGDNTLAHFNNGTSFSVQFSAGMRFWFWNDNVSLALYLAQPLYSGDLKIRLPGSTFDHSTSSIRRLGPSLAIGLAGDIAFIGVGWDELRNGSTSSTADPNYAPNQVLSRAVTFQLGFAPFAAARNVAGALQSK